jgi:hypothetical protein
MALHGLCVSNNAENPKNMALALQAAARTGEHEMVAQLLAAASS